MATTINRRQIDKYIFFISLMRSKQEIAFVNRNCATLPPLYVFSADVM